MLCVWVVTLANAVLYVPGLLLHLISTVLFSKGTAPYLHTFWTAHQSALFEYAIMNHYLVCINIPQLSASFPKPAAFRQGHLHCSVHGAHDVLRHQESTGLLQILLGEWAIKSKCPSRMLFFCIFLLLFSTSSLDTSEKYIFLWEYTLSVIELLTDPWDKTSKLELGGCK